MENSAAAGQATGDRIKVAVCEYLIDRNDDFIKSSGSPLIPPTSIDWLGNGITSAALDAVKFRELTVAIDREANECLYVDGYIWDGSGESTVYACDLAEAAGGVPVILRHVSVDWEPLNPWPDNLCDLPLAEASQ